MTTRKDHLSTGPQAGPSKAPRSLRIIIADDDRDTVLTLMMVLRHEGDDVRGVHDGKQALSALRDFEADAVFLDISMPDLSGWEVARLIKQQYGANRGPLLIGISGKYKQNSDKLVASIVGFDHYLLKPYEASDVLRLLASLRYPDAAKED